ncbi:SGNH/GDSL hydrolase family protein [Rubrivirga sp. IMCC45206]|uniref:SGNH/GDSL hydrolase family protein n=1 Tax=Rubrivirga sp. IMCC45206 TaxID=3391614 RepID=UPI00398FF847
MATEPPRPSSGEPSAGRPVQTAALVVLANVAGVVALLLLLEGTVRVLRPDIGPAGTEAGLFLDSAFVDVRGRTTGLRPGASGIANGERVAVDADGFHVYTGNASAPDSASTWLWLGDSVTFGVGVPADSTVAGRLAARQDTARILNAAVLGWGTPDYRRRLDAALAAGPAPARVTLLWCLNDADTGRPSPPGSVPLWRDWLVQAKTGLNARSRLYRLAKDAALDRPARYFAYDRAFYDPLDAPAPPADSTSISRALDDLGAIRDALAARGIPFEVVVAPYEPQLRPDGDPTPQEVLLPRLRALGIPTLDLLPAFRTAVGNPARLYLWSDGIHLSARGHAVAAEAIADWRREPVTVAE